MSVHEMIAGKAPRHLITTKQSNPKDRCGVKKVSLSYAPMPAVMSAARALHYGANKYGPFNWREVGVRASVYYDASLRHLAEWYNGEDLDADSKLSHIDHAIAGLLVLRDCMLSGNFTDDRPTPAAPNWIDELNRWTAEQSAGGEA